MIQQLEENNSFKLINLKKSLGINKLGKTEKRVLVALLEQREHYMKEYNRYYPEGNNYIGLAKIVYGIRSRAYQDLALKHSVYSTLSSVLHRLVRKKLVKLGIPHYTKRYITKRESIIRTGDVDSIGFMEKRLVGLYVGSFDERSSGYIALKRGADLPDRTHKWWMLTENGRKIAELLK